MVQAIQPFEGVLSGEGERSDMSWIPTENRGWRRVGRGSRGRRSRTGEGRGARMDL